jgi:hypothetical protein
VRVRPFIFVFAFAFAWPAHAKKPAPASDPLEGCKREPHGVVTLLTCGAFSVVDGSMPGALTRKTADSAFEEFAKSFPADARRDRVSLAAGDEKFPSVRISGDRGPKGPFQAQLVLTAAPGRRTRVLSCTGPHPAGGPDRCAAILAVLIAPPR